MGSTAGSGGEQMSESIWLHIAALHAGAVIDKITLPVTIYLSEEQAHDQVEAAVDDLLATAGLQVWHRGEPVIGSWFRRLRAGIDSAARSSVVREGALVATHAADTRLVLAQ